mmetsp:Transcript_107724/g.310149  ORF Transcript_107724/g.310149 Transcript_107724/m.310149 type:complete len:573 (+) Transcript_107724:112-1830(+)
MSVACLTDADNGDAAGAHGKGAPKEPRQRRRRCPSSATMRAAWGDLVAILRWGWPNSVGAIMEFFPGFIMLMFMGSDEVELAAAGMGFMFANLTGVAFIIGFGAGAAPLVSQAVGAGNWPRCGDVLQRQLAIHGIAFLITAMIWWNTESILVAMKQPATIARLSARFVWWRLPGIPGQALNQDLKVYLQAMNVTMTPMLISLVASGATIAGFAPLIARFGFVGASLSISMGANLQGLLMYVATRCVLPQAEAWPVWSFRTAFQGWGEILRLSLPGGALMLAEWWGWEINLFFAGLLCEDGAENCVELDVFPLLSTTMVLGFMCHFGFAIAAGNLIGNSLGAGDHESARRMSFVELALAVVLAGAVSGTLMAVRGQWGWMFTSSAAVVDLTSRTLPLIAAYIFLDALGPAALVYTLRGMGVVKLPALFTILAFYVCGIPIGLWLAFAGGEKRWGIFGLWSGLVIGMFTMVACLLTYLLMFVDWPEVAREAQERSKDRSADRTPAKVVDDVEAAALAPKAIEDPPSPEGAVAIVPGKKKGKYARLKEAAELETAAVDEALHLPSANESPAACTE